MLTTFGPCIHRFDNKEQFFNKATSFFSYSLACKSLGAEAQILLIWIAYISFHSCCKYLVKGAFKNHMDIISFFFDHPLTSMDTLNVKKWQILVHPKHPFSPLFSYFGEYNVWTMYLNKVYFNWFWLFFIQKRARNSKNAEGVLLCYSGSRSLFATLYTTLWSNENGSTKDEPFEGQYVQWRVKELKNLIIN